jgi:hypothetical protein
LGEHPVLVLRLARGQLRGERHLHGPQDVHRRCGLQQRHLRRPAQRCGQVVRDSSGSSGCAKKHNRTLNH